MAILKIKKLIEDLENNTSLVVGTLSKKATTAGYSGTSAIAGTASVAATGTSGSQL